MKNSKPTALLAIALLAGCGSRQEDAASQQPAQATQAPGKNTDAGGYKQVNEPLFEGYEPGFAYNLRADEVVAGDDGKQTRRVTLEYIGKDIEAIDMKIAAELEELGYKRGQPLQQGDVLRVAYKKKGAPKVSMTIYPAGALKTRAPDAGGFVRFAWPIDGKASD